MVALLKPVGNHRTWSAAGATTCHHATVEVVVLVVYIEYSPSDITVECYLDCPTMGDESQLHNHVNVEEKISILSRCS